MGVPHKHAEVLRAIADGKVAQWRDDDADDWFQALQSDGSTFNPISKPNLQWRIKPEPKPDVVKCFVLEAHPWAGIRFTETINILEADLRCTFNASTCELIEAEVI
jgi:hypothetical protein